MSDSDLSQAELQGTLLINANNVSVLSRPNFSPFHLEAAKLFTKLAMDIETSGVFKRSGVEHRAYVTNAIFSSVAFLESAVNEFIKSVIDGDEGFVPPVKEEARQLITKKWKESEEVEKGEYTSVLKKYQNCLNRCRLPGFKEEEPIYVDVNNLIELRNALVHFKPRLFVDGAEIKGLEREGLENDDLRKGVDFEKVFAGNFLENPFYVGTGNPYFPDKCLGSGCANWATQTAQNFADKFFKKFGITPSYQTVVFE